MNSELQEISFKKLIQSILQMWWLILIFVIVGCSTTFILTNLYIPDTYLASTTLFIGKDTDIASSISMSDLQLDSKLVLDYRELLRTKLVTREVIGELGLNMDYRTMVDRLDVETLSESRFVKITYIDVDPERAAQIVNKLSETLVIRAQDIVGVDNIQIVDYAEVPRYKEGPNMFVNLALAGIVAVLTALIVIFIIHKLDNRIRTKEDIEKLIGLSVLSEIPKFKGR
ncbi:Wzz/FepE/Etk N-terminal domain-containing protein [Vallitaleaceae bacterium 9-2]